MQIDTTACWTLLKSHYASLTGETEKKQRKLDKKRPRKIDHARRVTGICKELTAALDPLLRPCVDENLLEAAAILHDIAKFDNKDTHAEDAIRIIQLECLQQTPSPIDPGVFSALNEIISAHKGDFDPHPRYALEAALLRMADKLDKLREDWDSDAQKSYEKGLKKIRKYCGRLSESLEAACEEVLSHPKTDSKEGIVCLTPQKLSL